MRALLFTMLIAACNAPEDPSDAPAVERHALGMNDVTMLLPLPIDRAAPVVTTSPATASRS